MALLYSENCLNCGRDLHVVDINKVSFCCDECKETYYDNIVMRVAKKLGIDVPIEERWDILDL